MAPLDLKTKIGDSIVSTLSVSVWDNLLGYKYETMVFGPLDPENTIQKRYTNIGEAIAGHAKTVEEMLVKEMLKRFTSAEDK